MTFEVGKTYRTRDGETRTIAATISGSNLYPVEDTKGDCYTSDGRYQRSSVSDADLLPGAIEDAGGGLSENFAAELQAMTDDDRTPEPDTKWDRDARAALTGFLAGRDHDVSVRLDEWARDAARLADQMAAERARRGEVG